jgi:hypothetical protein
MMLSKTGEDATYCARTGGPTARVGMQHCWHLQSLAGLGFGLNGWHMPALLYSPSQGWASPTYRSLLQPGGSRQAGRII